MSRLPHSLNAFAASDNYCTPERRLMLATIINAISDAIGAGTITSPGARARASREAIAWFHDGGADFQSVSLLAGLEPSVLRRAALDFISSGKPLPRRDASEVKTSHSCQKFRRSRAPHYAAVIAAQAGVSVSSVRNVLNGKGATSKDMRHRVHSAKHEIDQKREAA